MVDKARKSLIGMFVVGACVLLFGSLFIISPSLFVTDKFIFECHFTDSLKGLSAGSPVYLMGVPVGQVETVQIGDPLNLKSYSAPVVISLNKDNLFADSDKTFFNQDDANEMIESYIAKGLVAQIESQSLLTGRLAIELFFTQARHNAVPQYDDDILQIPTTQERLSEVWEKVSEIPFMQIGHDIQSLLNHMNTLIATFESALTQSNIPQLSQDFSKLLISLLETSNNFNNMIVSNEKEFENIVSSFDDFSKNSSQLMINLKNTLSTDSVLIVQFSETLKALEQASKAIAEIASLLEIKPDALIFGK